MRWFILLSCLILQFHTLAQCDCKNIYVWKFNDQSTKNATIETDMADILEEAITARKSCVVLERRSYATVLMHEENEKRIQSIEDISTSGLKNLKAIKADVVVLATTKYEGSDSTRRTISVKFVNIFTKQILSTASISKTTNELIGFDHISKSMNELLDKMCGEEFSITNISVQDTVSESKGLLVDLDPLMVTWTSKGPITEMEVCLENAATLKRTPRKKVSSTEGALAFKNNRFENFQNILDTRFPGERNRIRVIIYPNKMQPVISKEFDLVVGIQLALIGNEPTQIEAIPMVDDMQVRAYAFQTELFLIDYNDSIIADLKTERPVSSPTFVISENIVRKVNWNRVGMISNCVREGIDDRMIRQAFMLDMQRNYK